MAITKMKAARYLYKENNNVPALNICEMDKPEIKKADEVLIKILNVAICGTDVNALKNPPAYQFVEGVVVGHECCGIVEEVGADVTNCKVGDKVVVHPNIWCGKCEACRTGHTNLCENFRHIGDLVDGAVADYLCIEERMVYVIDSKVPAPVASLAEPLACVLNGTTTFRAHPGDEVLVIGAGPIGLIFAMLYKAMGAHMIMSEPQETRRGFALDAGVDVVIDPINQDLEAEIRKYAPTGVDIVADAVGTQINTAVKVAKKGGSIALFGLNTIMQPPVQQSDIVMKELHVSGTYITKGTFPRAIKIIENNLIPIEKLITEVVPMEGVMEAVEKMRAGQASKIVIEVNKE